MKIIAFDDDISKILTIFSISKGSAFSRKDLKELTKFNNVNLDNAINTLINSKLLRKEKRLMRLNLDESKTVIEVVLGDYKNIRELPLDVYFSILDLVYYLRNLKGTNVHLFGSYAKLVYKEKSDIDILVISDKISTTIKKEIEIIVKKVYSRYSKKIEMHYFGNNFYKNAKDPFVLDVLKNGIKLI